MIYVLTILGFIIGISIGFICGVNVLTSNLKKEAACGQIMLKGIVYKTKQHDKI